MSEMIQKNAATIALIVAIIALVASMVPQINDLCKSTPVPASSAAPAVGPGPGMGGGMPGGGMGGRGPGMGGMMMRGPSEELKALYQARLPLLEQAIAVAGDTEEKARLSLERDLLRARIVRLNKGGFRQNQGATEAFLKKQTALASATATALEKNMAEIDFQQAIDSLRGTKEAVLEALQAVADYPKSPLTDEALEALISAETPQMGMGMGGGPGPR